MWHFARPERGGARRVRGCGTASQDLERPSSDAKGVQILQESRAFSAEKDL